MVEIIKLSKTYNAKEIFREISLILKPNIKYWIVGDNWSGKTTLFRLIIWEESADEGKIIFHKKNLKIWYMKQELLISWKITILEYIKNSVGIWQIETKLKQLENNLWNDNLSLYWDLLTEYENLDWYNFEEKVENFLVWIIGEKITKDRIIDSLSTGEKSKVLLIIALISWTDLLLLDEPTNNLDLKALKWLENYIKNCKATILIISHNRNFLDSITNKTLEIDTINKNILEYSWNYSTYEEYKAQGYERQKLEYEIRQEKIESLQEAVLKAKTWAKLWEKVKYKKWVDAKAAWYFKDVSQNKFWKKVKAIEKKVEQIDTLDKPISKKKIKYTVDIENKAHWYISFVNIKFKYKDSDFYLDIQNLEINISDRIVLLWENWSWKSTFLKILTGELKPISWDIYVSPKIQFWNFMQEHQNIPKNKTPFEIVSKLWNWSEEEVNKILSIFRMPREQRFEKVEFLSPGQRARLLLSIFHAKKYNALILDEPTNHLDMEAILLLEEAMKNFDWLLIVVSHDLKFLENLDLNRFILAKNNKIFEIDSLNIYLRLE